MTEDEYEQFQAAATAHREWLAAGRPPDIPHAEARRMLEKQLGALEEIREWLTAGRLFSVIGAEGREILLGEMARRMVTEEADDPRQRWRDDAEKQEFIARVAGYLVNGPPPAEECMSREEIRRRYGA